MPDFEIEFDVDCRECGSSLEAETEQGSYGHKSVRVSPCDRCMSEAKEKAVEDYKDENEE